MTLTLTWRSYKGQRPPYAQSERLVSGATIGRAPTNAFVVHDPDKYVSRLHAEVSEVGGVWSIRDQSSTFTIINGSHNLIRGQQFFLSEGDEITIGESVYAVESITEVIPEPPPAPSVQVPQPQPKVPEVPVQPAAPVYQPAPVAPQPFTPAVSPEPAYTPQAYQHEAVPRPSVDPAQPQSHSSQTAQAAEAFDFDNYAPEPVDDGVFDIDDFFSDSDDESDPFYPDLGEPPVLEPQSSGALDEMPGTESHNPQQDIRHFSAPSQDTQALRAFLHELDMEPSQLIGQNKVEVMKVAGILLRTLTEGMMGVLKARSLMREKLELDQTQIKMDDNNAFKFAGSPQDALAKMLTQEKGYMDPISAANEAVDDAKVHQLAMISGLNAAVQQTIDAFDPKELEREFEIGFSFSKKAKYWDLYCQIYENVAESAQSDSSNIFLKHFREHYEMQLLKLNK